MKIPGPRFLSIQILESLLVHIFLSALFFGLVFSNALISIGFTGLGILSILQIRALPGLLFRRNNLHWALLFLLFLILFLSAFRATDPNWDKIPVLSQMAVLPWVFYCYRDLIQTGRKYYFILFYTFLGIAAFVTVILSFLPMSALAEIANDWGILRDIKAGVDPEKFGGYSPFKARLEYSYLLGGAVIVLGGYWRKFLSVKWAVFVAFLLLWALLILGARAAQLSLFLAGGAGLVFYLRRYFLRKFNTGKLWATVLGLATVVLVAGTVIYLLYTTYTPVRERYDQTVWELKTFDREGFESDKTYYFTTIRRLYSWKYNLKMISDHPWAGVGLGDFHQYLEDQYKRQNIPIPAHAHNQFLFYWGVAGLPAILVFLAFILQWLYVHCIKARHLLPGLVMLFFVAVFLFDVPLNYTGGITLFYVLVAFTPILSIDSKFYY